MARTKQTARRSAFSSGDELNVETISKQQLKWWLKLNLLLESNDNNNMDLILNECLKDIVSVFGGIKQILFFLINDAKSQQNNKLQSIHEIISKQIIKHENELNDNTKINEECVEKRESVFQVIPNECIAHISGYLDKTNITSFKLTSRRIAVLCLDEMDKILSGIINLNHLINHNEFNNNLYDFDQKGMTIWNRYSSSTKYYLLYQEWYKQYNIPQKNQLIYKRDFNDFTLGNSSKSALKTIINKKKYLLFDNRNIVILNKDKTRKFDIEQDLYDNVKKYELMILEYFDINKQITKIVQFILYEGNISYQRLLKYIEYEFISIDGIDNSWYNELKYDLNGMSHDELNKTHSKLSIYQHKEDRTMKLINGNDIICAGFTSRLFTFQINNDYPGFNKIELKYKENVDTFYLNADRFCIDSIYLTMHFKGDRMALKSMLKYYYNSKCLKINDDDDDYDIDLNDILKWIDLEKCVEIRMDKSSVSNVLRHKISKQLFDGIIDSKNIELFDINNWNRILWNDTISEQTKNVYYSVVLYDIEKIDINQNQTDKKQVTSKYFNF